MWTVIFVLSIYLYVYIWALCTCDHVCEHVCICLHVCAFMSDDNLWVSVPLPPSVCLDQIQVVMLDGNQQYSLIYTTTIMNVSLFIFIFESKEAFVNNTQAWSWWGAEYYFSYCWKRRKVLSVMQNTNHYRFIFYSKNIIYRVENAPRCWQSVPAQFTAHIPSKSSYLMDCVKKSVKKIQS